MAMASPEVAAQKRRRSTAERREGDVGKNERNGAKENDGNPSPWRLSRCGSGVR